MSKIGAAMVDAEEQNTRAFHKALDAWDSDKLTKIVFHRENRGGKICLVNTKV